MVKLPIYFIFKGEYNGFQDYEWSIKTFQPFGSPVLMVILGAQAYNPEDAKIRPFDKSERTNNLVRFDVFNNLTFAKTWTSNKALERNTSFKSYNAWIV